MSKNKVLHEYDELIYEGYEELLAINVPITQVAMLLNEKWGTNFPESSLRGRYTKVKGRYEQKSLLNEDDFQARLLALANADLRLRTQRKVLVKERSILDGIVRESVEKSAVAQVIMENWGKPQIHFENVVKYVQVPRHDFEEHIYAYGDVHMGYVSDLMQNKYNLEIAQERVELMFAMIIEDVKKHGYKHITVADLGDQIEGSALRIGQLLRIAEEMTKQARDYANLIAKMMKWMCKELPDTQITFAMVSEDNHGQLRLFNTKRDEINENLSILITNHVQAVVDTAHEFGGMQNLSFIQGDEILLDFNDRAIVLAHGHQYSAREDILSNVEHRHGRTILAYIAAHWHQYSIKYKNVKENMQQALVHLPSVVGDTDFSDKLFLSCFPGFAKITIDLSCDVVNSQMIRL